MKKTIAFLTGIVCLFSMTACGGSDNGGSSSKSSRRSSSESSRISDKDEDIDEDEKDDSSTKITVRNCNTISAGEDHTVALKSDGTVTAVGRGNDKQCSVYDWTDIVAVSAGAAHTIGLKSNGTVVAVGINFEGECDVSDWTDIKVPEN